MNGEIWQHYSLIDGFEYVIGFVACEVAGGIGIFASMMLEKIGSTLGKLRGE
tara:strand:+ start:293 stop:448 length:156 start_codon:yes stop_codon:yes gene_type:complete